MRVVFRPKTHADDDIGGLLFVAVTDDNGTPIPDEQLTWIADGDHEALVIRQDPNDG
jgi:hypothetical protein